MKWKFCAAVLTGLIAAFAVSSASGKYIFPYVVDSTVSCSGNYGGLGESENSQVIVTFSYNLLETLTYDHKQGDYQISESGIFDSGNEGAYNGFFSDLNTWLGNNNDAPENGAVLEVGTHEYRGDNGTATVTVIEKIYTEKNFFGRIITVTQQ